MKTRIVRRAAGWAVLSLIPLTFVGLAVLAGQLAEMAVGVGIATFICIAAYLGLRLLLDDGRRS
ncbi:hypothetical protein ACIGXF_16715 [Streptomyces sp. NPDC053086]|uniref:hypothetical protein n=1 Tax=unclassified Streptomyces TaxID=2593676 RepID=UPI0037D30EDA